MPVIKPSLRLLTEKQVLRAIASGDEDSLIMQELSKLINFYVQKSADMKKKGQDPALLLKKEPDCPIDKIALSMVAGALKAARKNGKK
jgi:hypothetical protein